MTQIQRSCAEKLPIDHPLAWLSHDGGTARPRDPAKQVEHGLEAITSVTATPPKQWPPPCPVRKLAVLAAANNSSTQQ